MTRFYSSILVAVCCVIGFIGGANAAPTDKMIHKLNTQVLRVQVGLRNGSYGLGSGVVVAKNQVATNCHVVANAVSVNVAINGAAFLASGVKADWKHDVCVLVIEDLNIEPVNIRNSKDLAYEQSVFTIGFPGFRPIPTSAFGVVKGLFPMDDGVIMRATNRFRVGASGGGAFDDEGNLIGLITLKSPGRNAYYYYMATEWIKPLLVEPALPITTESEKPFWAETLAQWPYFMKVVHPYLTHNWESLQEIASEWVKAEPATNEAWFYLAAAEYNQHDLANADKHMQYVLAHNHQHSAAMYYLGLIAEESGHHDEALTQLALLNSIDAESADALRSAITH